MREDGEPAKPTAKDMRGRLDMGWAYGFMAQHGVRTRPIRTDSSGPFDGLLQSGPSLVFFFQFGPCFCKARGACRESRGAAAAKLKNHYHKSRIQQ